MKLKFLFINFPPFSQDPDEYKPVIRNLSEFKYWFFSFFFFFFFITEIIQTHRQYLILVILLSNICISFDIFDLPVFWPFLLFYFVILSIVTCKRLYDHMQKYGNTIKLLNYITPKNSNKKLFIDFFFIGYGVFDK